MTATVRNQASLDPETERFNPFVPGIMDDPYPYYRVLRDRAPVHFNEQIGFYFLSRYNDVATLGADRQSLIRGSSLYDIYREYEDTAFYRAFVYHNLFGLDDPEHGRMKRLITRTFTRARMERLVPLIEQICAQLIDEAELDQSSGTFELVKTLAYPLPFLVICELLGISTHDRDALFGWVRNLTPMIDPLPAPSAVRKGIEAGGAFEGYLTAVLGERRRMLRAGAELPPGLINDLVQIAEHDDQRLTAAELMCLSATILIAGFENVTNLISNTMRALAENPGELRALRDDPSLFGNLPDEALRYYSTTQYNTRQAGRRLELYGQMIPQGANVILLRGAANRDERHFPDPDTFDLSRRDSATHVGFGEGATFCTGAILARVEVRVAFRELLKRFSEFHIARWDYGPTKLFWGPRAADIEYTRAR